MRQAIAHALDKKEMINSAFVSGEFAEPANSILTPDAMYYAKGIKEYKYDKKKRKIY